MEMAVLKLQMQLLLEHSSACTADHEIFGEKAQNPADADIDFLIALK
jgi:hypothetical protein